MSTIFESLKSITGYPLPKVVIERIAAEREISLDVETTAEVFASPSFRLAKADIMVWVSFAPNVSQADVDYNLLVTDREALRKKANFIYHELGDGEFLTEDDAVKYGYKGEML